MKWTLNKTQAFDSIAAQWDELNHASQNLAIMDSKFISPAIQHFMRGDEILALGYENDQLVASGIFHKVGTGQWATVMPSQAPIALWQSKGHQLQHAMIESLAAALPGLVLSIDFLQMDSRDLDLVPAERFSIMPYIVTGNRPVAEDFDSYFASLGKNMRQNYNKVINRAARAGDTLETECISDASQMRDVIAQYSRLESKGWKSQEGTAVDLNNEQGQFYLEMMTGMAQAGQACAWYYKINGAIVAVDLCVIKANTLIILKTTYDEDFSKQSPALQLKVEMLKHYSAETPGIRNIEFYGRVMQWHQRLDSVERELQHVTWYKSGWVRQLKHLIKKIKP